MGRWEEKSGSQRLLSTRQTFHSRHPWISTGAMCFQAQHLPAFNPQTIEEGQQHTEPVCAGLWKEIILPGCARTQATETGAEAAGRSARASPRDQPAPQHPEPRQSQQASTPGSWAKISPIWTLSASGQESLDKSNFLTQMPVRHPASGSN